MSLDIEISEDLLTAKVSLPYDGKGYYVPAQELGNAMKAKGILFGIQADAIKKVYVEHAQVREKIINKFAQNDVDRIEFVDVDRKDLNHKVSKAIKHEFKGVVIVVAAGLAPVKGQDAQIEFEDEPEKIGIVREDGSMDFRGRNALVPAEANSILARHLFAEPGVEGKNILGQVLPAEKGEEIEIKIGENVSFEKETGKYICTGDGLLTFEDGLITVDDTITVEAVNLETGNLDVEGNVVVKENIESGTIVKVDGDLLVEGNIETANVFVTGNIVIRKGVAFSRDVGDKTSVIQAEGNIELSHASNAVIRAGGTVFVHTVAMHSDIDAGNAIVMTNNQGQLMGGEATALNYIQVNEMGSSANPVTKVGVGLRHCKRVAPIVADLESYEKNINAINEVIGKTAGAKPRLATMNKGLWELLLGFRFDLAERSFVFREKIADSLASYNQEMTRAIVLKEAFSKVQLSIDNQTKNFREREGSRKYWCGLKKVEWSPVRDRISKKIKKFEFEMDMELLASYSKDGFKESKEAQLGEWGKHEQKELDKLLTMAVKLVGKNAGADDASVERIGNVILLVEDQTYLRRIMKMKLETQGFEVFEEEDGGDAFKTLMTQKIDLAIVDLMMPGISGFQLCQMVRKTEKIKSLPIIVCSALNSPDNIKKAIAAGASNFIVKPYEDEDLLQKINKYLAPKTEEPDSKLY
jgi:uncharacterized protein (DUF342 family)/ActR/RegA family two-component response regulator